MRLPTSAEFLVELQSTFRTTPAPKRGTLTRQNLARFRKGAVAPDTQRTIVHQIVACLHRDVILASMRRAHDARQKLVMFVAFLGAQWDRARAMITNEPAASQREHTIALLRLAAALCGLTAASGHVQAAVPPPNNTVLMWTHPGIQQAPLALLVWGLAQGSKTKWRALKRRIRIESGANAATVYRWCHPAGGHPRRDPRWLDGFASIITGPDCVHAGACANDCARSDLLRYVGLARLLHAMVEVLGRETVNDLVVGFAHVRDAAYEILSAAPEKLAKAAARQADEPIICWLDEPFLTTLAARLGEGNPWHQTILQMRHEHDECGRGTSSSPA